MVQRTYLSCSWFSCEWFLIIFIYNYIFVFSILFTEFVYRYAIPSQVWYLQRIACGSSFSFSAIWDPETWTQVVSLRWAISLSLPLLHCNSILSIVFLLLFGKYTYFFPTEGQKSIFPSPPWHTFWTTPYLCNFLAVKLSLLFLSYLLVLPGF